jgi:hypothetical protein
MTWLQAHADGGVHSGRRLRHQGLMQINAKGRLVYADWTVTANERYWSDIVRQ